MKIKIYIISAIALILFIYLTYFLQFYVSLEYKLSKDSAVWGQFGDYTGGLLNPLLSFISIVLLIKSLTLQNEANSSLKAEIKNNEKTEKLRSFEVIFFNLINSQKNLFDTFKIEISAKKTLTNAKAVAFIEDEINSIRDKNGTDKEIEKFLNTIDETDQIFGISRAFYIIVMIITERLSDSEGFSFEDRKTHLKALINLTDFAQLRIIMICVQFMDYESARYLHRSKEFKNVIEELGLKYDLY